MQFTILSEKLIDQTDEQFVHEFRSVHAEQTKEMANSLGIISRYTQGVSLPLANKDNIKNLPLPEPELDSPIHSFAQLTWPSLAVLEGSFGTEGYKQSAGKHVFATSRNCFLTERLETEKDQLPSDTNAVRLVMVLFPIENQEEAFETAWDRHAARFRSLGHAYQRNMVIDLPFGRLQEIFRGTLFPAECFVQNGGYEEFLFSSVTEAQEFCDEHGNDLEMSYRSFCTEASFSAAFDAFVPYGESDRGVRQIVAGFVVGSLLTIKVTLGI